MNPNQDEYTPQVPPTPEQQPVQPPLDAPQVNPVAAPAQQQPAPAAETAFAAQPPVATAPQPNRPKVSKKLVIMISSIVGGLVLLGVIAWAVMTFITNNSMALKTYSGDSFSMLVPEKYEQKELSSSVTFKNPDAKSGESSTVQVSTTKSLSDDFRTQYIKIIDEKLNEDMFEGYSSNGEVTDFKVENVKHNGDEARKLTATVKEDGKKTGTLSMLMVFGEDNFYTILIGAHVSEPGLIAKSGAIMDSFKIN